MLQRIIVNVRTRQHFLEKHTCFSRLVLPLVETSVLRSVRFCWSRRRRVSKDDIAVIGAYWWLRTVSALLPPTHSSGHCKLPHSCPHPSCLLFMGHQQATFWVSVLAPLHSHLSWSFCPGSLPPCSPPSFLRGCPSELRPVLRASHSTRAWVSQPPHFSYSLSWWRSRPMFGVQNSPWGLLLCPRWAPCTCPSACLTSNLNFTCLGLASYPRVPRPGPGPPPSCPIPERQPPPDSVQDKTPDVCCDLSPPAPRGPLRSAGPV